jgi:hypothetical protein
LKASSRFIYVTIPSFSLLLIFRSRDIQGHTVAARAAGFGRELWFLLTLSRTGDKVNPADYPLQGLGLAFWTLKFDLFVHAGKMLFKEFPARQATKFVDRHSLSSKNESFLGSFCLL